MSSSFAVAGGRMGRLALADRAAPVAVAAAVAGRLGAEQREHRMERQTRTCSCASAWAIHDCVRECAEVEEDPNLAPHGSGAARRGMAAGEDYSQKKLSISSRPI